VLKTCEGCGTVACEDSSNNVGDPSLLLDGSADPTEATMAS